MPSWRDLRRFCQHDEWDLIRDTDHYFYQKEDPDGTIRFVKVSKGSGEINGSLWNEILKKQLRVTKEYFNSHI
jgi:hypothetical protein